MNAQRQRTQRHSVAIMVAAALVAIAGMAVLQFDQLDLVGTLLACVAFVGGCACAAVALVIAYTA